MIAWWWLPVTLILGIAIGITVMAICSGGWDKMEQRAEDKKYYKWLNEMGEKEKTADAGTSTAAHMGRKDYFL